MTSFSRWRRWALALLVAIIASLPGVVAGPNAAAATVNVTVDPPTMSTAAGQSFDLAVNIMSDVPSRGVQFGVTYNPAVVGVEKVSEGNFYKDWAKANNASSTIAIAFKPDNQKGQLSVGAITILGGSPTAGPSGSGTLLTISFTAKSGATGNSPVHVENLILVGADERAQTIKGVHVTNGAITIGGAAIANAAAASGTSTSASPVASPSPPGAASPSPPAGPSAAVSPAPTAPAAASQPAASPAPSPPAASTGVASPATTPAARPTSEGSPAATAPAGPPSPPAAAPSVAAGIPTSVPVVIPHGSAGIFIPWEAVGGFGGGVVTCAVVLYALRRDEA